mgnify:CR=1 FL=1
MLGRWPSLFSQTLVLLVSHFWLIILHSCICTLNVISHRWNTDNSSKNNFHWYPSVNLGLNCIQCVTVFCRKRIMENPRIFIAYYVSCTVRPSFLQQKYLLFYKCETNTGLTMSIKLSFLHIYLRFYYIKLNSNGRFAPTTITFVVGLG